MPDNPQSTYIASLDGVRCVAVLAVMVHHTYGVLRGGFLGVDLFFVLSGFLITSLLLREISETGTVNLRNFYIRRALRLLPALIVAVTLAGILWSLSKSNDSISWAQAACAAVFYYTNFFPSSGMLSHCWSLSVEEHFYFFWPTILVVLSKRVVPWLIVVTVALITSSACLRAYLCYFHSLNVYSNTCTRVDTILIGSLTALLLAKSSGFNQMVDHLAGRWKGTELCVCLILISFLCADVEANVLYLGGFDAIAVIMALLIAIVAQPKYSWLGALLSSRPFVWIGKRSYAIYLYDPLVYCSVECLRVRQSMSNLIAVLLLRICITLALAALSMRFVEEPALKLKNRFY